MFHLPPYDSKAQESHPPTHFQSHGWHTINCFHYLPHQHKFCFGLYRPSQFGQFTYIFETEHVCICSILNVSHCCIAVPKRVIPTILMYRANLVPICLPAHIHICSTLPHKINTLQFSLNALQLKWENTVTPLNSGIKTLEPSLLRAGSPLTIHALTSSQTPLHTSITPLSP